MKIRLEWLIQLSTTLLPKCKPPHCSNNGEFLVVQRLGRCDLTAGGLGSVPGWGVKIPQATQCSQKEK